MVSVIMLLRTLGRLTVLLLCICFSYTRAILLKGPPRLLDPPKNVLRSSEKIKTDLYFEQKIDHFSPIDTRTWRQRYHLSEEYYNESSKNHVFLMLGGEWSATEGWLYSGAWINTAKQYGALLIYLEHRYYGLSHPFSDLSTENLQFLSAHQALEDAATFIKGINEMYNLTSDAKWIVFGGSYAGTLAAWLRQKYPHLVAGAMSSSGPLEAILDFKEYLDVVKKGLGTHSAACVDNVKSAFAQLEELTSSCLEDAEIYEELNTLFQLCDPIEDSEGNEKDLSALFEILADDIFAYTVQYNGRLVMDVHMLCDVMVNDTSDKSMLERLAELNSLSLKRMGETCTDFKYAKLLTKWTNVTIGSDITRQWTYQTCTEFGFFQTSSQENPIFGSRFDLAYFTDLCVDLFGSKFNETLIKRGIQLTNQRYGAKNASTSNIVHFHGGFDPWHVLGKLETSEENNDKVIIVDEVSHCANMYSAYENEPAGLTSAKKEVDRLIGVWLGVVEDDTIDSSSAIQISSIMADKLLLMNLIWIISYLIW